MPNTPIQRSTRSGSNASAISLSDIKELIETSKSEILDAVKQENDKLRKMIKSLNQRLTEMECANSFLVEKSRSLEKRCDEYERSLERRALSDEDLMREATERHRRRKYLIVSGLQESSEGSVGQRSLEDAEKVKDLVFSLGIENFTPGKVSRIGRISGSRGRLLRFKCPTVDDKLALLRSSKKLRDHTTYNGVFINPDLTITQRKQNREIRIELKRRREAGESVIIRHGRVIDRSEIEEKNFR